MLTAAAGRPPPIASAWRLVRLKSTEFSWRCPVIWTSPPPPLGAGSSAGKSCCPPLPPPAAGKRSPPPAGLGAAPNRLLSTGAAALSPAAELKASWPCCDAKRSRPGSPRLPPKRFAESARAVSSDVPPPPPPAAPQPPSAGAFQAAAAPPPSCCCQLCAAGASGSGALGAIAVAWPRSANSGTAVNLCQSANPSRQM